MRHADERKHATIFAWSPFLLTFVVVSALLALQFANNMQAVKPFNAAHWVWDYSLGFVKRGLVGAATEAVIGPAANSAAFIERASVVLCVLAYMTYALFAALVVAARPSAVALATALSGALLASAFPAFAYDLGRADQLTVILALLACLAILRLPLVAALACAVLLSALAMLVHEAYFITRVPMLLTLALLKFHAKDGLPLARVGAYVLVAFAALAAVLGLLMATGSPAVDVAAWREHWEAQAPYLRNHSPDDAGDAFAIHHRGMGNNLRVTLQELRARTTQVTVFTLACIALVVTPVWFRVLRTEWTDRHRFLHLLAFLGMFSPVAMFLIGIDYMRWNNAILINAVLGVLCLVAMGPVALAPHALNPFGGNQAMAGRGEMTGSGGFATLLVASVAFVFLVFPQTSGVVEGREFPRTFTCLVHRLVSDLSRHPPYCLDRPIIRNPGD